MKKFLMVSLLAMSALTMMPNVSVNAAAKDAVVNVHDDSAVANATFWINEVTDHAKDHKGLALRLRGAGFAHEDQESLRKSLEFVLAFVSKPAVSSLDKEAKIAALATLLRKAEVKPGFIRRHAGNILVAAVVGGVLAADMGYLGEKLTIGEAGKLDAHTVLWAKMSDLCAAYLPTWLGGTPAPSSITLPVKADCCVETFEGPTVCTPMFAADCVAHEQAAKEAFEQARLAQEAAETVQETALVPADYYQDVDVLFAQEQARLAKEAAEKARQLKEAAEQARQALLAQEITCWTKGVLRWSSAPVKIQDVIAKGCMVDDAGLSSVTAAADKLGYKIASVTEMFGGYKAITLALK